ncbi:hypothetical protein H2201_009086, partial [Coniosporium apollinis]
MSSAQASECSVNDDNLELKQLYHDSIKQSGDVDVQVASDDPDQEDMLRMGKKSDLKRIFRQSSMIAFTCIVQATWQVFLVANTQGLLNGGHAGIFWSYIWTALGMSLVVASLAEMASMAPTSGGQYHWVSEFSPPQYQRFLSYMAGWMSTLSWHTTAAGATFVVGTLIQGVIVAYRPSFTPEGWQGTLFVIAVTIIVGIINVVFAERLPQIQKFMAILFGLGWIPVVVVLIVLAPHPDASVVFTQFSSTGGWMPLGLSVMVGQISTVYCLISFDAAAHMSEEVRKASLSVPRAMMWSYTANACVGLVVVFAYLYSIPSIEDALGSPTGFPILYVFQQATYHGTIPLVTLILIIATAGCTGCNASASRQTFAFARDDGLPFRSWISKPRSAEGVQKLFYPSLEKDNDAPLHTLRRNDFLTVLEDQAYEDAYKLVLSTPDLAFPDVHAL